MSVTTEMVIFAEPDRFGTAPVCCPCCVCLPGPLPPPAFTQGLQKMNIVEEDYMELVNVYIDVHAQNNEYWWTMLPPLTCLVYVCVMGALESKKHKAIAAFNAKYAAKGVSASHVGQGGTSGGGPRTLRFTCTTAAPGAASVEMVRG